MHTTTNVPTPTDALPVWPPASLAARERLRGQAIAQAHALRREAIAELWGGAGALWGDAVDHTRRAADRLAARLRQHAKRRALGDGSGALGA
jgi:hypothetical protein